MLSFLPAFYPLASLPFLMLNEAQIRTDFNRMRTCAYRQGELVDLTFGGTTVTGIKTNVRRGVTITNLGETFGTIFAIRFLDTDFSTAPNEKDVVTVAGVDYQVGEVATSHLGVIYKIILFDEDA